MEKVLGSHDKQFSRTAYLRFLFPILYFAVIVGVFALQIVHVQVAVASIHKGPDEFSTFKQVNALGRRIDEVHIPCMKAVRRQKFAKQNRDIDGSKKNPRK